MDKLKLTEEDLKLEKIFSEYLDNKGFFNIWSDEYLKIKPLMIMLLFFVKEEVIMENNFDNFKDLKEYVEYVEYGEVSGNKMFVCLSDLTAKGEYIDSSNAKVSHLYVIFEFFKSVDLNYRVMVDELNPFFQKFSLEKNVCSSYIKDSGKKIKI